MSRLYVLVMAAVVFMAACFMSGCTSDESRDRLTVLPGGSSSVSEFVITARPSTREFVIRRIRGQSNGFVGVSAQSIDDLTIDNDGTPGSGSVGTVELVTNSVGFDAECPVGYQSGTFCGNVTLRSFLTHPVSHVYAQVTAVQCATGDCSSTHGGINNDPAAWGLSNAYGLWSHTADVAGTPSGVIGMSPANAATRDWVFANPDNADTVIYLRVVAALAYADYAMTTGTQPFVDACVTGTDLGQPNGSVPYVLPFPFTLYATTSSNLAVGKKGQMQLGSGTVLPSGTNVALPSVNAFQPGFFPFWDATTYRLDTGRLCTEVTGSAPNRRLAVTMLHMKFTGQPDSAGTDFSYTTLLHEGTNAIVFLYGSMVYVGGSTYSGDGVTIGVQNETASSAAYTSTVGASNSSLTLTPQP